MQALAGHYYYPVLVGSFPFSLGNVDNVSDNLTPSAGAQAHLTFPYKHQPVKSSDRSMPKERLNQIEKKIGEKPVFVISKSYCPFCKKAKQVLKKYNIKPENIEIMEIDNDEDCNEIQVKLALH